MNLAAFPTPPEDRKSPELGRVPIPPAILHAIGFTVKLKPVLKRRDGSTKADWDIGIALDVYEAATECDTVILATGDGDFVLLLNRIKKRFNTDCEVYGVPALSSDLLTREASKFVAIDQHLLLK